MISKTKVKGRIKRKTNPEIIKTIELALDNTGWFDVARILSSSTRKYSALNLYEIDKEVRVGDTVVIPGKVLSKGELTKKVKICAISISEMAKEKLKKTKSEYFTILNEIKKNPKAEGIKILK